MNRFQIRHSNHAKGGGRIPMGFLAALGMTVLLLLFEQGAALAQSPRATPFPSPTVSEEEVNNSLQERLKKATQEKGEKAETVLGTKNKLAIVGKLSDISNNTLTIRTREETNELATTDSETTFVRNNKTVDREDIQIGDWIIAMGYRGDNGNSVVVAKRVVAKDKPTEYPKRIIVKGTVKSVQTAKKNFILESDDTESVEYTISIPSKSEMETGGIEAGKTAILIAEPDKTDTTRLTLKAIKIL